MTKKEIMTKLENATNINLDILEDVSETAAKQNKIPKIIHFCFLDWVNMPDLFINYIKSWFDVLDDSYVFVNWTPILSKPVCDWEEYMLQKNKFAFYSDYIRVSKTYEYGGIYFDCDVLLRECLNSLLDFDYLFCTDMSKINIECAAFLTKRHNNFLHLIKNEYESISLSTMDMDSIPSHFIAPFFWNDTLKKNNCKICIVPKEHFPQYSNVANRFNTQSFFILECGNVISTKSECHRNKVNDIIDNGSYIIHGHEWTWTK